MAALTIQAHPGWDIHQIRSAIVNTGAPAELASNTPRLGGSGLVQPVGATRTQVSTFAAFEIGTSTLNFGFSEVDSDLNELRRLMLKNHTASPISFNVSSAPASGSLSPHTLSLGSSTITLAPWSETGFDVTLHVPASTVGSSINPATGASVMRQVAGIITFTPTSATQNNGVALQIPYYLVPRGVSKLEPHLQSELTADHPTSQVNLTNSGPITGTADFYAWGLDNSGAVTRLPPTFLPPDWELNEVGVQSFPTSYGRLIVFAVNTRGRWSSASTMDFRIFVSTTGGKFADFLVEGFDFGRFTAGAFDGRVGSFVFKVDPNTGTVGTGTIFFLATAPSDKSTILLPVRSTQLGLTAAQPRFSYSAAVRDVFDGGSSTLAGPAFYNAWNSAVSQGQFASVSPGGSVNVPVSINVAEEQITPAMGLMIVGFDNLTGDPQARVIPVAVPAAAASPGVQPLHVPSFTVTANSPAVRAPAATVRSAAAVRSRKPVAFQR